MSRFVKVDYDKIIRSSDRAVQVDIAGEGYWIPKSQVQEFDEEECWFEIPEWLAEDKGLV